MIGELDLVGANLSRSTPAGSPETILTLEGRKISQRSLLAARVQDSLGCGGRELRSSRQSLSSGTASKTGEAKAQNTLY